MAQLYGSNGEESYAPSHGSGQNVYLVSRAPRPDETNQAKKKPLVVNYYPSGSAAGPQRYIAEVQAVSHEVIRRPVAVPVKELKRGYRGHVDGQSKRDDKFIARIQDGVIEANTGKLLGLNLDQAQGVPTNYQGRSTIDDRWTVQPNSLEEQNPRKVAELFNKVSNWRGTNDLDRGRSSDTHGGWSNNPSDRYKQPTQSGTTYGNGYYGGRGSQAKLDDGYDGRNNNIQAPQSGRSYNDPKGNYVGSGGRIERPFTPQGYDNHGKPGSIRGNYGGGESAVSGNYGRLDDSYAGQTESLSGGGGLNKPLSTQHGYGQPVSYGGDTHGKPSSMRGDHGNREDSGYGNHGNVSYGSGGGGLNKPLSTQQGYGQPVSYGGDAHGKPSSMRGDHSNGEDSGYGSHGNMEAVRVGSGYTGQKENLNGGSGLNKPLSTHQGYDQPTSYGGDSNKKPSGMGEEEAGYGNRSKLDNSHAKKAEGQQAPRAGSGYTSQADQFNGGIGWKKPITTQQVYDQPTSYRGDSRRSPSSKSSDCGSSENRGHGNPVKSDDYQRRSNNPQALQGRYDYDRPRVEYDGGKQAYGYGDGIDTRRNPSSISKRDKPAYESYGNGYNTSVRPAGINTPEITSKQAVEMYKGAFVSR